MMLHQLQGLSESQYQLVLCKNTFLAACSCNHFTGDILTGKYFSPTTIPYYPISISTWPKRSIIYQSGFSNPASGWLRLPVFKLEIFTRVPVYLQQSWKSPIHHCLQEFFRNN